MLKIINDLKPFIEDNYKRINVREYARMQKITPPTASKILDSYRKEGLLKMEADRNYLFYFADKEDKTFIDILRIYWRLELEKAGLIGHLKDKLIQPLIILFGSLSKAEVSPKSDIDLAVFTSSKKELDMDLFEERLKRKIQIFIFNKKDDLKNQDLMDNIKNGYIISGMW